VPIIFALLAFPFGLALGAALVINLVAVLGLTALVSPMTLLPAPLVAAIAPLVALLGSGTLLALLITLVLIIVVVFTAYTVASFSLVALPPRPGLQLTSGGELVARGVLIGINCALNFALLLSLIGVVPPGLFVATALAVVNLFAAIPSVSNNTTYQTALAYTTLFLPMAFVVNIIGFLFWMINSGGFGAPWFPEWRRANLVVHGGITFVDPISPYNLANFTMVPATNSMTDPWVSNLSPLPFTATGNGSVFHEDTHTLNVGAFGFIYHLVGFADENLPMPWSPAAPLGLNAYAELCAEGGLRDLSRNWIAMWTASLVPPSPANRNALAVVTLTPGAGVVLTAAAAIEITINCEVNRGVTLDSAASFDPDAYPITPLGRLWVQRLPATNAAPSVPVPLAIGTALFVFVPAVGGTHELEFWVTDGINGNPTPIPPLAPPPAPPSPPPPLPPDDAFRIHVTAIAAAIAVPQPLPAVGGLITLDSAPSTGAGIETRIWLIEAGPGASAGLTATGNIFQFTLEAGQYVVSLTIQCSVTDIAGNTVLLTDRVTTTLP
jgi:hypothetical protein